MLWFHNKTYILKLYQLLDLWKWVILLKDFAFLYASSCESISLVLLLNLLTTDFKTKYVLYLRYKVVVGGTLNCWKFIRKFEFVQTQNFKWKQRERFGNCANFCNLSNCYCYGPQGWVGCVGLVLAHVWKAP